MIVGQRVRLRRIERDDLPRFVAWLNDPEVRDHLALYHPMGLADEERWFEDQLRLEPALRPLCIEAQEGGLWVPIGSLGLHQVDWKHRWGELGIVIGDKAWWGRGFGTDAVRTFVDWCFDELNLNRFFLRVFESNERARHVYRKLGFRDEGRLRQDRFHAGRYEDTVVMGILRDERGR
jgi:diamine N-acetyltransferase